MDLVEEAVRLGPELEAAVGEGEAQRRLPDGCWKLLLEGGFVRALQPARFGGGEITLVDFVDVVVAVSKANPSAGWVTGVIGVHPWQLALFPEEAQQEMWGQDPTRMHSSSYNPTGRAERVDGGYQVSGRWSFSSGCDHCIAVNVGAVVADLAGGKEIPDFRSFLLYGDQYRIEDNWFVAGMKGTGSKDIVVDGTFVPDYRTQSHVDYALGLPLPGQEVNPGPLYRLPWSVVFNMALAASVYGTAQGFMDAWTEEASTRVLARGHGVADDPIMQRRLAEAVWILDASLATMRRDAMALWDMAEAQYIPTMADRGRIRWNINRGCELVGDAVADLFRAASGRTIFADHPLQRRFQDVQGALGHAFLVADPLARAAGGSLLGTATPELVL